MSFLWIRTSSSQNTLSMKSNPFYISWGISVLQLESSLYVQIGKPRSDVDAKQEELRLMVGYVFVASRQEKALFWQVEDSERYRDLLQASTSIISMAESSKEVLDTVTRMKRTVTSDLKTGKSPSAVRKDNDTEGRLQKFWNSPCYWLIRRRGIKDLSMSCCTSKAASRCPRTSLATTRKKTMFARCLAFSAHTSRVSVLNERRLRRGTRLVTAWHYCEGNVSRFASHISLSQYRKLGAIPTRTTSMGIRITIQGTDFP